MLVILPEWILKSVFAFEYLLRPLVGVFVAKDPAFHILGFDYKDAKGRKHQVVDLCGAAIVVMNHDIVQKTVSLQVEVSLQAKFNQQFAKHSLHSRLPDKPSEKNKNASENVKLNHFN